MRVPRKGKTGLLLPALLPHPPAFSGLSMGPRAAGAASPTITAPGRVGVGGECHQLLPPLLALGFWRGGCQGAAGASVSLGLGPWSPSSTWLSRPVSLPGKRSGLKISWRDSTSELGHASHKCRLFRVVQLERLKRKLQRLRPAIPESVGCSSPAKIVSSVPT